VHCEARAAVAVDWGEFGQCPPLAADRTPGKEDSLHVVNCRLCTYDIPSEIKRL
jgi:hypothetical protein